MECTTSHFKAMDRDVLSDIMSRLDGCTLASLASTCTFLREVAQNEALWRKLCHETWPSTSTIRLPFHPSSRPGMISFKNLYRDAFPLILYEKARNVPRQHPSERASSDFTTSPTSPCQDFISLVDIYYKDKCIFSKVVDGLIGEHEHEHEPLSANFNRFLSHPFVLDLVGSGHPETSYQDFKDFVRVDDHITNLLVVAITGYNDRDDLCGTIAGDMRLSWIMFDRKSAKAVNISSWKPRSIHGSSPLDEGCVISFGCVVPTRGSPTMLPKFSEVVIVAKCKLRIQEGCITWNQIRLVIEGGDGSRLDGKQSLRVINQSLHCSRSTNHTNVEKGYRHFQQQKIRHRSKAAQKESITDILCATMAIASLLAICYACATLL